MDAALIFIISVWNRAIQIFLFLASKRQAKGGREGCQGRVYRMGGLGPGKLAGIGCEDFRYHCTAVSWILMVQFAVEPRCDNPIPQSSLPDERVVVRLSIALKLPRLCALKELQSCRYLRAALFSTCISVCGFRWFSNRYFSMNSRSSVFYMYISVWVSLVF